MHWRWVQKGKPTTLSGASFGTVFRCPQSETNGLMGSRPTAGPQPPPRPVQRINFQGSSGLGDAAWVFVPREPHGAARPTCRLVGQGTVQVKETDALVAVDAGVVPRHRRGRREGGRVGSE